MGAENQPPTFNNFKLKLKTYYMFLYSPISMYSKPSTFTWDPFLETLVNVEFAVVDTRIQ
jgi:hypothetical protein